MDAFGTSMTVTDFLGPKHESSFGKKR